MRHQALLDDLRHVDRHDHVAWWGADGSEFERVAVDAFTTGMSRGERMIFIAEDPAPDRLAALPGLEAMLDRGDLLLATQWGIYGCVESFDPSRQAKAFEEMLDDSLDRGYTGMRVVADGTPFALANDSAFAAWVEWEHIADRILADHPVMGVCFFDSCRVPSERLADLACIHQTVPFGSPEPPFRLVWDDGVLRVAGSLEALFRKRMGRMLAALPTGQPIVVDVSCAEFLDHRGLLALNEAATPERPIVLRGVSPAVQRLWYLLAVTDANLVIDLEGGREESGR